MSATIPVETTAEPAYAVGPPPVPSTPGEEGSAAATSPVVALPFIDPSAPTTAPWAVIGQPVGPPVLPETGPVTDGLVYVGSLLLFLGVCLVTGRRWGR